MKVKVLENGQIKEVDLVPESPQDKADAQKAQQAAFDAAIKKATEAKDETSAG